MISTDITLVWVVALLMLAGAVFGGDPDLVDALVFHLMRDCGIT